VMLATTRGGRSNYPLLGVSIWKSELDKERKGQRGEKGRANEKYPSARTREMRVGFLREGALSYAGWRMRGRDSSLVVDLRLPKNSTPLKFTGTEMGALILNAYLGKNAARSDEGGGTSGSENLLVQGLLGRGVGETEASFLPLFL